MFLPRFALGGAATRGGQLAVGGTRGKELARRSDGALYSSPDKTPYITALLVEAHDRNLSG